MSPLWPSPRCLAPSGCSLGADRGGSARLRSRRARWPTLVDRLERATAEGTATRVCDELFTSAARGAPGGATARGCCARPREGVRRPSIEIREHRRRRAGGPPWPSAPARRDRRRWTRPSSCGARPVAGAWRRCRARVRLAERAREGLERGVEVGLRDAAHARRGGAAVAVAAHRRGGLVRAADRREEAQVVV